MADSYNKKDLIQSLKEEYIKGNFLYNGNEKFYLKSATYGTFKPQQDGIQFPESAVVETDFKMMAQNGLNCVRTYTVPPIYLLNIAFIEQANAWLNDYKTLLEALEVLVQIWVTFYLLAFSLIY